MNVSVTLDLSVAPGEKHAAQMRSAALCVTDDPNSVQVSCPPSSPKQICAQFSVPDARQEDVVGRIGRQFWNVENYNDSSIGFSRRPSSKRRTSRPKKPKSDQQKFRQFVETHVPGGTADMSDADLTHLQDLIDPSARPEVAMGLIREMDALLGSDDNKRLEQWMAESAATGIRFSSIQEARAYLAQFRALLKRNLTGRSP
jgi:hypothetical protein